MSWVGLEWIALNWVGLDWVGLSWVGLVWFGLVQSGFIWFRFGFAKYSKPFTRLWCRNSNVYLRIFFCFQILELPDFAVDFPTTKIG